MKPYVRRSVPAFAYALLVLALFWRVFFLGETLLATDILAASPLWERPAPTLRNPWLSDTVEYYYPCERLYSESIRAGELPVTNPYVFNGAPVPHGIHIWNSIWPVKLAFLLAFDPVRSYDFFALFHLWLAGAAFYALCRGLGCGGLAAFAAGLAYMLSGRSMLWLHGHYLMATLAYAPLVFLAARRGSAWTALPLAGLFFTNPHAGIAVAASVLVFNRRAWKTVLAGVLLAGVVLVPLTFTVLGGVRDPWAEASWFYRDGPRCWLFLAGLVWPGLGLGSMAPNEYNVYVGLVPLAGAVLGARRAPFFAGLAGTALAAATLWPLPVWLGPVSFSLPTRWLFLFTLGSCVCFARALDGLPARRVVRAAAVLGIMVDLVPRFVGYNVTSDPSLLRRRPEVVASLKGRTGTLLADHPQIGHPIAPLSLWGVESVQGYDVMVPRVHVEALGGAAEVWGGRMVRLKDPESPALEALGMRYLVTDRPLETRRLRRVRAGGVFVYENPSARDVPPRRADPRPVWAGFGVTLAGCVLGVLLGLLDRSRGSRYSGPR
jgi:hypothetical protein